MTKYLTGDQRQSVKGGGWMGVICAQVSQKQSATGGWVGVVCVQVSQRQSAIGGWVGVVRV